jgi:hypothetical protein
MYLLCALPVTIHNNTGTILSNVAVSFGPSSFAQYLVLGVPVAVGTLFLHILVSAKVPWRDVYRALQDNFTVFMTLLRAVMIGE